jgi:hypothetical protein
MDWWAATRSGTQLDAGVHAGPTTRRRGSNGWRGIGDGLCRRIHRRSMHDPSERAHSPRLSPRQGEYSTWRQSLPSNLWRRRRHHGGRGFRLSEWRSHPARPCPPLALQVIANASPTRTFASRACSDTGSRRFPEYRRCVSVIADTLVSSSVKVRWRSRGDPHSLPIEMGARRAVERSMLSKTEFQLQIQVELSREKRALADRDQGSSIGLAFRAAQIEWLDLEHLARAGSRVKERDQCADSVGVRVPGCARLLPRPRQDAAFSTGTESALPRGCGHCSER